MSKTMQRWLSASAVILAAGIALPGAASAQLLFDWGGAEKKVNDTGRQQVRISVDAKPGDIIVSFSDRRLFLMTGPGMALSYPVAIPREQDRWEGVTSVSQKRENPSWTPTPTMIKENPKLPRWVPGGHPMNPLGNRALYLGSSLYRIHGTDAPWTIGTAVSKGCIRMYNKDALDVYERSKVGAKVLVTWKSYQFQPTPDQPQAIAAQAQPDAAARYHSPAGRGVERIDRGEREQQASVPKRWRQPAEDVDLGVPPTERVATPREAAPVPGSDPQARASARSRDNRETRREARDGRDQRAAARDRNGDTPAVKEQAAPALQASPAVQAAPVAHDVPLAPKARSDASQKAAASIETGSVSERRARAKAATPVAAEQNADTPKPAPQAQAAPQPDIATRALEAAERAAAAAERAAAAAERAERAVSAKAAAPAAAVAPEAPAAPLASD